MSLFYYIIIGILVCAALPIIVFFIYLLVAKEPEEVNCENDGFPPFMEDFGTSINPFSTSINPDEKRATSNPEKPANFEDILRAFYQPAPKKPFILRLFELTVKALKALGEVFNLSYNAVNIIIWYMLLPLSWAAILDYKLHQIVLAPLWLLLCIGIFIVQRKHFNDFCNMLFRLSQVFISSFGNYVLWSVIICLLLPLLVTIVLVII